LANALGISAQPSNAVVYANFAAMFPLLEIRKNFR